MQASTNNLNQGKAPETIFGQWIGKFEGKSSQDGSFAFPGFATFNIERDRPQSGFACIDQGQQIHGSRKDFTLQIGAGNRITGQSASTIVFDWRKNETISVEESVRRQEGKVFYFEEITIDEGFIDATTLTCSWHGKYRGQSIPGTFNATRLKQSEPSQPDKIQSWEEFKRFAAELIKGRGKYIFRGQASSNHRLKTSFHRENRYDLLRYNEEDCKRLEQHINATSFRQYNRSNPADFGALLSLAQHHGFPTPLLDWSWSPYVAAYFALSSRLKTEPASDNHRIYVLDATAWKNDTAQALHFADPRPVITVEEFPAHNNPRHLPQQSVHAFSNVEDIEGWIRFRERINKRQYLTIIDIPRLEREFAMRDLAYMGVTAASLFPGLDGVCRSLKEQFFP
ncbi:MAG TPA: FRG domain-containing protein [Verrucomicrobiae bacterium]|nr:FRG domain-containing protein [Verrucomicrobiae bacterium]